jgi:hypothetical protein
MRYVCLLGYLGKVRLRRVLGSATRRGRVGRMEQRSCNFASRSSPYNRLKVRLQLALYCALLRFHIVRILVSLKEDARKSSEARALV